MPIRLGEIFEFTAPSARHIRSFKTTTNIAPATCFLLAHPSYYVKAVHLGLETAPHGPRPYARHGLNKACHLTHSIRLRDRIFSTTNRRRLELYEVQRLANQQTATMHAVSPMDNTLFHGALPPYRLPAAATPTAH